MKTTRIRELLLAGTIISGMIAGTPAFAQTTPAPAADEADETVIVTGTRIQTPGTSSSSPINTIGAAELDLQQSSEVERVLRNLPITVPGDGGNTNNGTAGVTTVNLRDLGPQRNLIMIDGKRVTPYNINGIVDVSVVPTALLERVDIVTGGASAVYGSDAISGAINFVLRRNFEGFEVNYERSVTGVNDGETNNLSLVLGANTPDDRGNVAFVANYTAREGVQFGARPYGIVGVSTASGAGLGVTGAAEPANCSGQNTVPTTFGGSGTTLPARIIMPGYDPDGAGPLPAVAGGRQFRNDGTLGANCNQFNFNPYNYYQTPQERYSGMAVGHYAINDDVEAYGRISFAAINVRQQIAPSGIFSLPLNIPVANPYLTASARQNIIDHFNAARLAGALTLTGANQNWFDHNTNGVVDVGDTVRFGVGRRTVEFGERSTTYDNNAFQAIFGLRGTFLDDSWNWDVSIQHGESDRTNVSAGYTNVANIAIAANTVSTTSCTTATGVTTAGCVPINLFGPEGSITSAMAGYASAVGIEQQSYLQTIASASMSGPIDALQSPFAESPLMVAFGVEYREEEGATTPDECLKLAPSSCLGGAGGNSLPIVGGFSAQEFFAEAIMPLATDRPLFQSLELELGVRYSDFDPTGPNTTWKAGLNWALNDSVRFRVMQQRAVRAPNVGELAAPLTSGLDNATGDPCSVANTSISSALRTLCISTGMTNAQVGTVPDIIAGQINIFSGTNLALLPEPETADTTTIGVVFTPTFLEAFNNPVISVDYYNIEIEGFIGELTAQEVLDLCYTQGLTQFCSQIVRQDGNLIFPGSGIQLYTQNLSWARAEGVDFNVSFGLDMETLGLNPDWGSLSFSYNASFSIDNSSLSSPVSTVIDCLGFYGNSCGNPSPEFRHVQRTTWNYGDFRLSYLWRHIGETNVETVQRAATFDRFETIEAYNYIDLYASYALNSNVDLSVSVNNVFDKDPPIVGGDIGTTTSNGGNTFPQVYDSLGRVITMGVALRF